MVFRESKSFTFSFRFFHTSFTEGLFFHMLFFVFEKPYFSLDSSAISDEFSISSNDTMAGDDDRETILMIGSPDSTYGFWMVHEYCFFFVASRLTIRDFHECVPCLFLKIRSKKLELNIKLSSTPIKIFSELFFCLGQYSIFSVLDVFLSFSEIFEDFIFSLFELSRVGKLCHQKCTFMGKQEKISNR